jgi:hypothetical protein
MELGSARLNPQFARDEESLRTRLSNSGITAGSDAWNAEMQRFGQTKNDAMNSLLLSGRSQANQELLTERNQPINEISALMSGSQVSNPSFTSTPQTNVGGVDYAGMVANNYNAQNDQYKAQLAQQNAQMGGMFGLGGTLAGGVMKYGMNPLAWSDRRLKSDIELVGVTNYGLPLYEYTINGERQRGVMADEVLKVMPEAVVMQPNGFYMVNYRMLGLA